jgi:hypothetical protein
MGKKNAIISSVSVLYLITIPAMAQPDLVINKPRLAASLEIQRVTFSASDCSVVEGCAPEGSRKLLKFDVGFQNAGNADLIIGDPTARPDLFEFSPCHGHFHMHGVADYDLISADGTTVVRARKQGWCFRDNNPFRAGAGPAKYDCANQGITAGWEDIYDKSLDCQWLDITGIPGGQYRLRVTVNPDHVFEEANYANNSVSVPVILPGAVTTPPPPTTQPPPIVKTPPPPKPKPMVQPAVAKKKIENPWKKLNDKAKKKKPKKKKAKGHGNGLMKLDDDDDKD